MKKAPAVLYASFSFYRHFLLGCLYAVLQMLPINLTALAEVTLFGLAQVTLRCCGVVLRSIALDACYRNKPTNSAHDCMAIAAGPATSSNTSFVRVDGCDVRGVV